VSGSEVSDGLESSHPIKVEASQGMDGGGEMPVTGPVAVRQPTGDQAIDEVLAQLDAVADAPLEIQIEVGERVHRVLQDRLADLGADLGHG
jgi:hypothetical protein